MTPLDVTPGDEGRHSAGPEQLWGESWYLDWAAPDASTGGYVRLGLYPNLGLSWWWIALVGEDRPLVLVVDHTLPCPAGMRRARRRRARPASASRCRNRSNASGS
jgi:hypothetical protein